MPESAISVEQTIFPSIRYTDARSAISWLERAFGAQPTAVYDADDGSVGHAEMLVAGNLIMFGTSRSDDDYPVRSPKEVNAVTGGLYVLLPDAAAVDAMHERTVSAGASVAQPPYDTDYGSHEFRALDLEGHPWTFGTYRPELPKA